MKRIVGFGLALGVMALAGCGADGEPQRPQPTPQGGIAVSGNVSVGIAGSL